MADDDYPDEPVSYESELDRAEDEIAEWVKTHCVHGNHAQTCNDLECWKEWAGWYQHR